MSVDALYTEIIMMHNKSKHNRHLLDHPTTLERGHNPNCGDDLTLLIEMEGGVVKDAAYQGTGCAISQASISIMIDLIKGLSLEAAKGKVDLFFKLIHNEPLTEEEQASLGDAIIFESLSQMPARVKCGSLGWHCFDVCLNKVAEDN